MKISKREQILSHQHYQYLESEHKQVAHECQNENDRRLDNILDTLERMNPGYVRRYMPAMPEADPEGYVHVFEVFRSHT